MLYRGLKTLSDEEFDPTDAESVQVCLDAHISDALRKIPTHHRSPLDLHDTIIVVLGNRADSDLLDWAESFQDLINTYGGNPSEEDMDQAAEVLESIIDTLGSYLPNKESADE